MPKPEAWIIFVQDFVKMIGAMLALVMPAYFYLKNRNKENSLGASKFKEIQNSLDNIKSEVKEIKSNVERIEDTIHENIKQIDRNTNNIDTIRNTVMENVQENIRLFLRGK